VSAVREQPPELREQRPPDWSSAAAPPPSGPPRPLAGIVVRATIGAAFVAAMWLLGHRVPAAVLAAVLVAVTTASMLFPAVARWLDRAVAAIQRVAGRVLSVVVLGAVGWLLVVPVSLVLRVLGHDPLALGLRRDAATAWRPVPRREAGDLYRRPFAYERMPRDAAAAAHGRRPFLRVRAAIGLLVLVAAADVALGALIDAAGGDGRTDDRPSLLLSADVPAGRTEPWAEELGREVSTVWYERRFDPYLGWFEPDFAGEHVHVAGGVRRSYEPAGSRAPGAVEVAFLGGSTMFGAYQRDEHTIPSEIARLAEADGLRLRVLNLGQQAYLNWQEVQLLQQRMSGAQAPDLAVFYDGANELVSQFALGVHREPSHLEARQVEERLKRASRGEDRPSPPRALYRAWADTSAVNRLANRLRDRVEGPRAEAGGLVPLWSGDQAERPEQRGAAAAAVHARGVRLARRLAGSFGVRTAFFWQPHLYSKRRVPGEEQVEGTLATDPEAWRRADRAARARLAPGVFDLSRALDGVRSPVMYDFLHTNEVGARAVARAMYARLEPTLRELARERSR
jgi:hypothetical protein